MGIRSAVVHPIIPKRSFSLEDRGFDILPTGQTCRTTYGDMCMYVCMKCWWNDDWQRKTVVLGENPAPLSLN
jgi:hypothetical protein